MTRLTDHVTKQLLTARNQADRSQSCDEEGRSHVITESEGTCPIGHGAL